MSERQEQVCSVQQDVTVLRSVCKSDLETQIQLRQGVLLNTSRLTCAACRCSHLRIVSAWRKLRGDFPPVEPCNSRESLLAALDVKGWSQRGQPTDLMRGAAFIGLTRHRCQATKQAKPRLATIGRGQTKLHTANCFIPDCANAKSVSVLTLGHSFAPTSALPG